MLYHHGHLLFLAGNAYKRSLDDHYESFVSIMLSAMSLECYINDFSKMISNTPESEIRSLQDLSFILDTLENSKASLIIKIEVIHHALTGQVMEKGSADHQELVMLIRLRNELVHRKPESENGWGPDPKAEHEPHNIVKFFSDKGIIERPSPKAPPVWSQYTNEPEVAQWAFNCAVSIIKNIIEILPQSNFKYVQEMISKDMKPI